ncbi:interleukin-1 alpha [Ctenodactylus gundi]
MAKVPDVVKDLRSCYRENEDCSAAADHKSFYDASSDLIRKNSMDKSVSPNTSDTPKTPNSAFAEDFMMVSTLASGKILRKRRLSFHEATPAENLEATGIDPEPADDDSEEETANPWSASSTLQDDSVYKYKANYLTGVVLTDVIHQCLVMGVTDDDHLRAMPVQNSNDHLIVRLDMIKYITKTRKGQIMAIKISKTQKFLCAQKEGEVVLLKELPTTPKIIQGNDVNLLFKWETYGSYHYFKSAANPELFLATQSEGPVIMAKGLPYITDFKVTVEQS